MEILCLPVLNDNYIFLLVDRPQGIAAVVDPALAAPVLEQLGLLDLNLVAIFNTHHHRDHIGGNRELKEHFPELIIYGGVEDRGRIPGQDVFLVDGDRVKFGDRSAQVYFVPGHTRAHIAYYFAPVDSEASRTISGVDTGLNAEGVGELFCGDTIFAGGCGRLSEGTPAQMFNSLERLRELPDRTRIWCAHEYTLHNLQFALTVDENNPQLQARFQEVERMRSQNQPTIPTWLGIEKQTNPFLRWDAPALQTTLGQKDTVQTFTKLRSMKDFFTI
jgi:hydroxyacylglutathione hydrolase